ncbi:hypothetical protein ACRALDRAFT_1075565 [Sodiomyces alcalophilus JCM 7366]|uniref:uncharacterized protein n=1 Tax=Sodiomyces alcalophilus JCM 7366 TaxID=591952 RepID=UPI0039B60908
MSRTKPGASSITVAVRVRPFTIREAAQITRNDDGNIFLGDGSLAAVPTPKLNTRGIRSVIKVVDDRCLVFDPPEDNPVQRFSRSVVPNGKKVKDQVFAFDRIFDENSTQNDVYEATTKNLLDSILDGYNATVFAYGATGCGKTHTITGSAQQPGIIFLTMQELFEKIDERSQDKITEVTLSYLEIYNETIRDLLVPGGSKQGLMLREDSNQAVSVAGLTSHRPKDVQEVMDMIVQGNEYRTVSPTEANAVSSRSHAVLQVNVAQRDRNADVNEPHTMATLSIIDLAGSERASATKNRGERLLEGANINKSLLALGSCINALCDPRKRNHVPYRNSKLTRLLKFSLGGNCKTVMIVCVSPSSIHFDETQNTLRYANRAKNIQTKVTRNVFNVNRHVKDYLVKIDEQMALINELKAQQKDAENVFFAKFRKQQERRDAVAREGIQRIRAAYDNAAAERQEKIASMKKLRGFERRIGLLSAWLASFDAICDARVGGGSGDHDAAMPQNLFAIRKTAQGILAELENSRHHIRQRLDKFNWERALDTALHHSIKQLLDGENATTDCGEVANLTREVEVLKASFGREAYREVLDSDKAGDAAAVQVLLTAQFDILSSLAETLEMNEHDAVAHAKQIINRLLDVGFSAASQVVKPDGTIPLPVEKFSPRKRGTPKRKKTGPAAVIQPLPFPAAAAAAGAATGLPALSQPVFTSPLKGTPRRRKPLNARKGVSVVFSPMKKRSPSKRTVRWRDDETEEGTLADYEKTPKMYDSTPEQQRGLVGARRPSGIPVSPLASFAQKAEEQKAEGREAAEEAEPAPAQENTTTTATALVAPAPAPASPAALSPAPAHVAHSSPSIELPETTTILPAKPNRFQAGFLSKGARISMSTQGGSPHPSPPTFSLRLTSSSSSPSPSPSSADDGGEDQLAPLRSLDVSRSSNLSSAVASSHGSRIARLSPPRPSLLPGGVPDENNPPTASWSSSSLLSGHSSDSDNGTPTIDAQKLRSALHSVKKAGGRRMSSMSMSMAGPGAATSSSSSHGRRVSSIGFERMGHHQRASSSFSGSSGSANGISRHRRMSAERRRSPPITCSPPEFRGGFTPGQARRMNFGGSMRSTGAGLSHGSGPAAVATTEGGSPEASIVGGEARNRRVTIGGMGTMAGPATRGKDGAVRASVGWR